MWFKACLRCKGDLYVRDSEEGKEIVCMQCGFIASPRAAVRLLGSRYRHGGASLRDAA